MAIGRQPAGVGSTLFLWYFPATGISIVNVTTGGSWTVAAGLREPIGGSGVPSATLRWRDTTADCPDRFTSQGALTQITFDMWMSSGSSSRSLGTGWAMGR